MLLHYHCFKSLWHNPCIMAGEDQALLSSLGLILWNDGSYSEHGMWRTTPLGEEWVERILRANELVGSDAPSHERAA